MSVELFAIGGVFLLLGVAFLYAAARRGGGRWSASVRALGFVRGWSFFGIGAGLVTAGATSGSPHTAGLIVAASAVVVGTAVGRSAVRRSTTEDAPDRR
jgi:hypothetical protein